MSVPNWRKNAQLFTALTTTDTTVGIYVGPAGDLNVVNVGESTVSIPAATRYRPSKGEPVVLTWTNGRLRLTGPARAKASDGKILALHLTDGLADVLSEGKKYSMPMSIKISQDLTVNDAVVIDWTYRNGYVKDKLTAPGVEDPAEPRLTIDQKPFTLYVFAKQSGSRKTFNPKGAAKSYAKWWTPDVIADDDNVGGWFYGNVLRKSLRDDAFISSVEVFLPVRHTKGGLPKIGRHTKDTRPTGDDSLSVQDADTRKARSGWVKLPTEWAEAWRSNAGGVAVSHGGTTTYKGIQAARQSGKLRIRGRQ
jgi:hypothetical protein